MHYRINYSPFLSDYKEELTSSYRDRSFFIFSVGGMIVFFLIHECSEETPSRIPPSSLAIENKGIFLLPLSNPLIEFFHILFETIAFTGSFGVELLS